MDEYGEAIESDLRRFYGIRLLGLWSGELTWRELGVLVRGLPVESLTKTALRNATPDRELSKAASVAEYGPWSQTDMLLARLVDLTAWLQWAKTKDGSENKNPPEPYPRPGVKRPGAVDDNVVDMLEYLRAHNGAAPGGYVADPGGATIN